MGSVTVYEGRPTPVLPGDHYRVWYGWRSEIPGATGHVASFSSGRDDVFARLSAALRRAKRYEKAGHHTKITRVTDERTEE